MKLFVCLDDNGGMMFGGRRQSRDRILISDMLSLCSEKLQIFTGSELLFNDFPDKTAIVESMPTDGNVFTEDGRLVTTLSPFSEIVIYKWNRIYPADVHFGFDLKKEGFCESHKFEFAGSSHECITRITYTRR